MTASPPLTNDHLFQKRVMMKCVAKTKCISLLRFHPASISIVLSLVTVKSQERGGWRRYGGPSALGDGSHVDAARAASCPQLRGSRKAQRGIEWTDKMLCLSVSLCLPVWRADCLTTSFNTTKSKNAVFFPPRPFHKYRSLGALQSEPVRGFYFEALSLYLHKGT